MRVTQLHIYPVKSLAGISLEQAQVMERGFQYDRHWMITNPTGRFFTQREVPEMSLITTRIENGHLHLGHKQNTYWHLSIALSAGTGQYQPTVIWDDRPLLEHVSPEADAVLSDWMGTPARLLKVGAQTSRPADPRYVTDDPIEVSMADGYPYLLIGQASLDDLNARLEHPVPMNRFRPNIVVEGSAAFAEDTWKLIRIGNIRFRLVKPCARCVVTTINQDTAEASKEPLQTLSSYRKEGQKVLFGQNMIALDQGQLRVGDPVEVLE
jgi:uncharacterized protein YcbX